MEKKNYLEEITNVAQYLNINEKEIIFEGLQDCGEDTTHHYNFKDAIKQTRKINNILGVIGYKWDYEDEWDEDNRSYVMYLVRVK